MVYNQAQDSAEHLENLVRLMDGNYLWLKNNPALTTNLRKAGVCLGRVERQ